MKRLTACLALVWACSARAFPIDLTLPQRPSENPYSSPNTGVSSRQADWVPTGPDTAKIIVKGEPDIEVSGKDVAIFNRRYENTEIPFLIRRPNYKRFGRINPHKRPSVFLQPTGKSSFTPMIDIPVVYWSDQLQHVFSADHVETTIKPELTKSWDPSQPPRDVVGIADPHEDKIGVADFLGWSKAGKAFVVARSGWDRSESGKIAFPIYEVGAEDILLDLDFRAIRKEDVATQIHRPPIGWISLEEPKSENGMISFNKIMPLLSEEIQERRKAFTENTPSEITLPEIPAPPKRRGAVRCFFDRLVRGS